jgi:anti-sigma-K factor RskA
VSNQHVLDLLPLYALGALEPDEQALVEAHLPQCAACRAEADELLAVAGSLAASVPARAPHPRVRQALLRRLSRSNQPASRPLPSQAPPRPQPPTAGRRPVNWPMTAMLAGLIGLLAWNVYLTDRVNSLQQQYRAQAAAVALISSPITESTALRGQGSYNAASGRAYIDPDSRNVVLIVEHLSPLDEGQTYQAWIITDSGPQNAGLVNVSRSGWGMSWLDVPYPDQAQIGVSVEPAGGSASPTEVVLLEEGG